MPISDATPEQYFTPAQLPSELEEVVLPSDPDINAIDPKALWLGRRSIFERAALPALIAISVYAAFRSVALALTKPLWFDEIATQVVSRQRNFSAIWAALKAGADGNPPPFYLFERLAAALPLDEHLAYRLPAILALPFTLLCIYLVVRRNDGPLRGFVSACILLLSQMYGWFAAEARPYGLLMACVACALLCYQRAGRRAWALGLFLSLTLAMCTHYYAVFVFVPFVAAELTLTWQTRRPRPLVWSALLLSLAPLAVFWPLLAATKATYGAHLWSSPHMQWRTVLDSYSDYFSTNEPWGWALAAVCVGAIVFSSWRRTPAQEFTGRLGDAHEHVLALGFIFLPAIGLLAASLGHGGIIPRYCLSAVFGVALATRYALRPLRYPAVLGAAALVLFMFGAQELGFWTSAERKTPPGDAATSLISLVNLAHRDDLPVVVSDPLAYLQIEHYAPPEWKARLVGLADPDAAVKYVQTDSADRGLLVLRRFLSLNVQSYAQFSAAQHTFLVYSDHMDFEWVLSRLTGDGLAPRLLASDGPNYLYLVESKPD